MSESLPIAETEYLTIAEIAKRFRVSEMSVRRMIARDEIQAVQFGRQWRVPTNAVASFIASRSNGKTSTSVPAVSAESAEVEIVQIEE